MIFNLGQRCASRKLTTRPRTFSYLTAVRKNSVIILGQNKTICEGAHYLTGSHNSQRTFCISLSRSRPWNVVFYGTDDFALETLKALHSESLKGMAGCVESVDVVTATDRVRGYQDNIPSDNIPPDNIPRTISPQDKTPLFQYPPGQYPPG